MVFIGIQAAAAGMAGVAQALVPDLVAGTSHTLAVRNDGRLWAWGAGGNGRLGLGDTARRTSPTQVGALTTWVAVAAGDAHSLGLQSDGSLWAWGYNNNGQLGLGDTTRRLTPVRVGTESTWAAISAGGNHSMALKSDGSQWAWGQNSSGQLGLGDTTRRTSPVRVGTAADWSLVEAGFDFGLALKADGSLYAWGGNAQGQLGLNDRSGRTSPVRVGADSDWTYVSGGKLFSLGRRLDGSAWAWGNNANGELGLGDKPTDHLVPARVGTAGTWSAASADADFSLFFDQDHHIWSCGENGRGQLGLGNTTDRTSPVQLSGSTVWAATTVGDYYSSAFAFDDDGSVWSWGYNNTGQLGLGDTTNRTNPTPLAFGLFASSPGALDITQPAVTGFAGITLTGAPATSAASMTPFTVTDSRTAVSGWRLNVSATRFTSADDQLPAGSLTMAAPDRLTRVGRILGPLPTLAAGGPFVIDDGQPVTLATAAPYTMGTYRIGSTDTALSLAIPADCYAGTYTSTLTFSLISGP